MKKSAIFLAGLVLLLSLVIGCSMPALLAGKTSGRVALPPDAIGDQMRSSSGEFTFETLLPVDLSIQVDLYQRDLSVQGSSALLGLAPQEATVFATLTDSKGNQVYAGRLRADGTLEAQVQVPAALEDMTLTLSGDGLEERSVSIREIQRYSAVSRRMGMIAAGPRSKGDGLLDTDADGVPDIHDVAPADPAYAFSTTVPADGYLTIAFEDLFRQAQAGDADYNDFIAKYKIEVRSNGDGITAYRVEAEAVVKLAGYNHLFGILVDRFAGGGTLSIEYYDKNGVLTTKVDNLRVENQANVVLFPSTRDSVKRKTVFTLTFDKAQSSAELMQPPLNPYLLVSNTGYDIHMIGRQALPSSRNPGDPFRDAQGFPWALLIPVDWKHPIEAQRIEIPYPRFPLWRESSGDEHVNWYLHYYDPYIPSTDPTVRLIDINPGTGGSSPANLLVYNSALYFGANDGTSGAELWKYVGGAAGLASDINASGGSNPQYFTEFNGKLYFSASDGSGAALYAHSGASTVAATSLRLPAYLTVYNSTLYLAANDPATTYGQELWSYDGVTSPTVPAADIYVGNNSFPGYLTVMGTTLYFQANDGSSGAELWKYASGTASLVGDINVGAGGSDPSYLTVYNGALYFRANDGSSGYELWRSDGTSTTRVADLNSGSGDGVAPSGMAVYNNALYFCGTDGTDGWELYRYNGSVVSRAADLTAGSASGLSVPTYFAVYDGKLYFGGNDGSTGAQLYSYDGSAAALGARINAAGDANPKHLAVYNNRLYFQATDGSSGAELWEFYY